MDSMREFLSSKIEDHRKELSGLVCNRLDSIGIKYVWQLYNLYNFCHHWSSTIIAGMGHTSVKRIFEFLQGRQMKIEAFEKIKIELEIEFLKNRLRELEKDNAGVA